MATPNNAPNALEKDQTSQRDEKPKKDIWDIIELFGKGIIAIVALIVIPIVINEISGQVQRRIAIENTGKDYIGIALGILERKDLPEDMKKNIGLRKWAVGLLQHYSPVKLDDSTADKLTQGETEIPIPKLAQEQLESKDLVGIGQLVPNEYLVRSFSPDGKKVASITLFHYKSGIRNIVSIYDLLAETEIASFDAGEGAGTPQFAWSPDSTKLLFAWTDVSRRAVAFDLTLPPPAGGNPFHPLVGNVLGEYRTKPTSGFIDSISFSEDGRSVNIKTTDGKTQVWQLP
jgi:hypothetical protein